MSTVIKVENLSKQYRLGSVGLGSLGADVNRWWHTKIRGKEDPYLKIGEENNREVKGTTEYVWALRDINFDVQQGEVLGIIGRNGAGKSTLLKILSRTTGPTTGSIKIKGRVASLLEVGTGFHPELTGRENIFLNGAILGMTKQEIKSKFDEIVDFAGVERYVDTPVKRYSSGMYVRLAFAVAAHLEPEILIVDEVLAVGDVEFQKKAIGKMKDVSLGQGRTVMFVSHNMGSIRALCHRGMLLEKGKIKNLGTIGEIIDNYEMPFKKLNQSVWVNENDRENAIFIDKVRICDSNGGNNNQFISSEDIFIEILIQSTRSFEHLKIGFDILKGDTVVFRSQQVDSSDVTTLQAGQHLVTCCIPRNFFNEGRYSVRPLFSVHCVKNLLTGFESVLNFSVILDTSVSEYHSILQEANHPGIVYPFFKWQIESIYRNVVS